MNTKDLIQSLRDKKGIAIGEAPPSFTPTQTYNVEDIRPNFSAKNADYVLLDSDLFFLGNIGALLHALDQTMEPHALLIVYHPPQSFITDEHSDIEAGIGVDIRQLSEILSSAHYDYLDDWQTQEGRFSLLRMRAPKANHGNQYQRNSQPKQKLLRYAIADKINDTLTHYPTLKKTLKTTLHRIRHR